MKVTAEVELDVVDPALLERAALAAVDTAEFSGGEVERQKERARVMTGPAAAAEWLLDPFLMTEALPGVESTESTHSAVGLYDAGMPAVLTPDFATLFALCSCGAESCDSCAGFQLTPRTALALWSTATVCSDSAYDDIELPPVARRPTIMASRP